MLNRESILAAGFTSEIVETPIGDIRVRVISGAVREHWESVTSKSENNGRIRASWIALTACNEDGSRMFSDDDIEFISTLDATFLIPVFEKTMRLNGLAKDSVEEAEKN